MLVPSLNGLHSLIGGDCGAPKVGGPGRRIRVETEGGSPEVSPCILTLAGLGRQ